jgi:hypothetical protein
VKGCAVKKCSGFACALAKKRKYFCWQLSILMKYQYTKKGPIDEEIIINRTFFTQPAAMQVTTLSENP